MSTTIFAASRPEHYDAFRALTREFKNWSCNRYRDYPEFVEDVFRHPSYDWELTKQADAYRPPRGITLLAARDGVVFGGVALRTRVPKICEMNRLYVRSNFRGIGAGRQLCLAAFESARAAGLHSIRLETAHLLAEALNLYRSIGFSEREPYYDCPAKLRPFIVFMEHPLDPGPPADGFFA